jgi:hypothetical protein
VTVNRQPPSPDVASVGHGELLGLAVAMLRFIQRNPGCAQSDPHERYTDGFWRFVLELRRRYPDVPMAAFAAATDLPQGTVEDWLHGGRRGVDTAARAQYHQARRGARARLA